MASSERQRKAKKAQGSVAPAHDHSTVLTADGQINISQSKVKSWRNCRRQYHYKFVLMIQKKVPKRPFMFGGIVHQICEADFERQDWVSILEGIELDKKKLFRKERDMYGNIILDIRDIMTDYFAYWEDHPSAVKPIKHGGRRSEHEFRIELDDGLWFTGKVDAVVKSKGLRWVMEHKTFSRMPSEDDRWRSVQAAVYFRALEMIGFEGLDGVLWDYVSSKPPGAPGELTPTGKLSTKRIDSTPSRILRWMKEEGKKKRDPGVLKLMNDAETNLRNRFLRIYSPVKKRVVDIIWEDFLDTAHEIQDLHGKKKDQNVGRHCTWCDYQPLCRAEATGGDLDWILEREYQQEDQSHKGDDKDRTED